MRNFDIFIGIDWSGAKAPLHTPAIAVAKCYRGDKNAPELIAPNQPGHDGPLKDKSWSTYWSRTDIFEYILDLLKTSKRIFIGVDANFGYAQDIGEKQFGKNYDYKDLWGAVEKESAHDDNFLAAGYWEKHSDIFWVQGKKPDHITLSKRQTETICAENGYGRPESPFKLIGAKQVGKGGLAAMRMAYALKENAGDQICIWPFEREITDTSQIVISEIYPRQFLMRCGHGLAKVNTLSELNEALEKLDSNIINNDTYRFSNHDADSIVSSAGLRMICGSQKTIPKTLSYPPDMDNHHAKREGWIFGVGDQ